MFINMRLRLLKSHLCIATVFVVATCQSSTGDSKWLATTTLDPNQTDFVPLPMQNKHTIRRHTLHARTGSIDLKLGTQSTNNGSNNVDHMYRDVYQALKNACKHPQNMSCEKTKGKFVIWVGKQYNVSNYT
jgi:hypothetical protein